ncbi:MAG: sulfite exporter TauE/SafE family protein [Candidatus Krumholzibacteriia bacterium]
MNQKNERRMGWEIARDLEREKATIWQRIVPEWRQIKAALGGVAMFFVVFLLGCWLAGHSVRMADNPVMLRLGWAGTSEWGLIWSVLLLALVFEFMDASAGMGFGTALTPVLLVMGFDPLQIVPVVLIQQSVAGLVGAFLHREFQNVEWRFRPLSETVRLCLIIAASGTALVLLATFGVYAVFDVPTLWIKLYVALLLLGMGVISLVQSRRERPYRPRQLIVFGALAGFNKGVGGGGYGPVVTIGGLLAGVPVKSMLAVTALSEGIVCLAAVVAWFVLTAGGVAVDYVLLPSVMLASMVSAVIAPYLTRVFPERLWRVVVPSYCLVVVVLTFWKLWPELSTVFG